MTTALNDFFLERAALHDDLIGALARLYDVSPFTVYFVPMTIMPYPPQGTTLLIGWYLRGGKFPLHISPSPFGDTTLHFATQEEAIRAFCRDLGVSCLADISEDVGSEWVRVTPDGRVERVIVDEDDLDDENGFVRVQPLGASVST